MEDDILELFHEEQNSFTIFVVEIQFATGRGLEYFRKFKGKENYIDSNFLAENTLQRIITTIKLAPCLVLLNTRPLHHIPVLCKPFFLFIHPL